MLTGYKHKIQRVTCDNITSKANEIVATEFFDRTFKVRLNIRVAILCTGLVQLRKSMKEKIFFREASPACR